MDLLTYKSIRKEITPMSVSNNAIYGTLPVVFVAIQSSFAPEQSLQQAVQRLRQSCKVLALSSVYRNFVDLADQPPVWLMVVKLATPILPAAFQLNVLDDIEQPDLGTSDRWRVNIDILLWGNEAFAYGEAKQSVPHPRTLQDVIVATALVELAPNLIHPQTGQKLIETVLQMDTSSVHQTSINIR
jgi:7,8-dihydro-6-hydroxymethylpterin-pyrophosphokinase